MVVVLSSAGFGPVCQAACDETVRVLGCGGHAAAMHQADAQMMGMERCATCAHNGPAAAMSAGCTHESAAEVLALAGSGGTQQARAILVEGGTALGPMALPVEHFPFAETPPLRVASSVSLHTILRV